MLQTIMALGIGMGLAASCGFRVFMPLLIAAIAAKSGMLALADGFEWLSTWPAIVALGVATVLEIAAYYVPWLDNLLDTVSTPAAVVAGIIASAACVTDVDPMLKWSVAIIAGGGIAGIFKTGAVVLRTASSATTGGAGNPIISTIEWMVSVFLSILTILLPLVALIVVAVLLALIIRFGLRVATRLSLGAQEPVDESES